MQYLISFVFVLYLFDHFGGTDDYELLVVWSPVDRGNEFRVFVGYLAVDAATEMLRGKAASSSSSLHPSALGSSLRRRQKTTTTTRRVSLIANF